MENVYVLNGFTGEFREDDNKTLSKTWLRILLILIILGVWDI